MEKGGFFFRKPSQRPESKRRQYLWWALASMKMAHFEELKVWKTKSVFCLAAILVLADSK